VSTVTYAGFLARVLAAIIDMMVVLLPAALLIQILEPGLLAAGPGYRAKSLTYIAMAALWIGYEGGMESSRYQATIGKLALRIYVTDLGGNRLPFSTAAYRCWPLYVLNIVQGVQIAAENVFRIDLGIMPYVGTVVATLASCLAVLGSPKRQGLHDWLCGTLVLKRPAGPGPE